MKSIVLIALALAAVAVAAPPEPYSYKILRSEYDAQPNGAYNFGFETENGIKRAETGEVKEVLDEDKKPHTVVVVRGSYDYPGEDGKPITVVYVADEYGFQAQGDHIPKPARR